MEFNMVKTFDRLRGQSYSLTTSPFAFKKGKGTDRFNVIL